MEMKGVELTPGFEERITVPKGYGGVIFGVKLRELVFKGFEVESMRGCRDGIYYVVMYLVNDELRARLCWLQYDDRDEVDLDVFKKSWVIAEIYRE